MSSIVLNRRNAAAPFGIKPGTGVETKKAPRVVIGLGGSAYAAKAAAQFRALGWEVVLVGTGEEARRQAVRGRAHALVLGVEEAGLLDAAKLVTALPRKTKVVFVAPAADPELERASGYLDAGFATEADGVSVLVREVLGLVPACGN